MRPHGFLLLLVLAGSIAAQSLVRVVTLPGKVRDFMEYDNWDHQMQSKSSGRLKSGHPDFQHYLGYGCKGAVESRISKTDIFSIFPYDNRGPKMNGDGCWDQQGGLNSNEMNGVVPYAGRVFFPNWYNDTTVSDTIPYRSFLVPLRFNFYSDCRMVFNDSVFFPLDSGKEYYSLSDPAQSPFGKTQKLSMDHDYGFTLEFHSSFSYIRGSHQTFSFKGDDDVWVFVNDSLVIDLGGVHPPLSASVDLDNLPTGFLVDGRNYMLDFFSAERHTTLSNIRITTTIIPEQEGVDADTTVQCSGRPMAIPPSTFPPSWYVNWKNPVVSGYIMGADGLPLTGETVTLVFSNGGGTVQTDTRGFYSTSLPRHWSGTVTVVSSTHVFTPTSATITDLTVAARQNFSVVDSAKTRVNARVLDGTLSGGSIRSEPGASVDFMVAMEQPGALRVEVHALDGRMVWNSGTEMAARGMHRVRWSNPTPGLCIVRTVTTGSIRVQKLIVGR